MDCTSTNPVDVGLLATGSSTGQYEFQNMNCSAGFSEGDVVGSVFSFFVLAAVFLWWLDAKIFGIKVTIRQ